jgi:hypothetical protein
MKTTVSLLVLCGGIALWTYILALYPALAKNEQYLAFTVDSSRPIASGFQTSVSPHKKYIWSTEVTASNGSGEFGFYIDEFDTNGTWISGQWKGSLSTSIHKTFTFTYIPSSEQVASAAPQYYIKKGSSFSVAIESPSIQEN